MAERLPADETRPRCFQISVSLGLPREYQRTLALTDLLMHLLGWLELDREGVPIDTTWKAKWAHLSLCRKDSLAADQKTLRRFIQARTADVSSSSFN